MLVTPVRVRVDVQSEDKSLGGDEVPKTTSTGKARKSELPSTLQRSDAKAQRTFAKAHDSAAEEYGEGRRAHQTAYAALKRTHKKVGDHWEPKGEK